MSEEKDWIESGIDRYDELVKKYESMLTIPPPIETKWIVKNNGKEVDPYLKVSGVSSSQAGEIESLIQTWASKKEQDRKTLVQEEIQRLEYDLYVELNRDNHE